MLAAKLNAFNPLLVSWKKNVLTPSHLHPPGLHLYSPRDPHVLHTWLALGARLCRMVFFEQ